MLKDKYPDDVALVESVQKVFNRNFKVISDRSIKAMKSFPMQFTQRIPTSGGEWTTQLHIWADHSVPELLDLDPVMLTARNSDGESVLFSLLMAATGRFTQMVDYELLQKILDKDMRFTALTIPNDETSGVEGNAWDEEDIDGNTPLDYLADFATGTGIFAGQPGDEKVQEMLANFADRPDPEDAPRSEPLADPDFNEKEAAEQVAASEKMVDNTLATEGSAIPTADLANETTATPDAETATPVNSETVLPKTPGKEDLLEALVTIGRNYAMFG